MSMNLLNAQILMAHARVLAATIEIQTEAYLERKTEVGCGWDPEGHEIRWRPCTPEEKLKSAQGDLGAHLDHLADLVDALENEMVTANQEGA